MKTHVALILATLMTAGCGGGGGGTDPTQDEPAPTAPSATENEAADTGSFSPAADPKPSTEPEAADTGTASTEPTPESPATDDASTAPSADSGAAELPDSSVAADTSVVADTSKPSAPDTSVAVDSSKPDTKVAADSTTPDTKVAVDSTTPDTKPAADTSVADTSVADTGTAVADTGPITSAWRKANLTTFTSYPDPGSEECIAYSGCTWAGQFAALDGKQTEAWVKSHNIAAVHSKDFGSYKMKTLRLRQGTKEIDVTVYDMCADTDCSGCCTANAKSTGFLIDIEKYTAERFGTSSGTVEWTCLDC